MQGLRKAGLLPLLPAQCASESAERLCQSDALIQESLTTAAAAAAAVPGAVAPFPPFPPLEHPSAAIPAVTFTLPSLLESRIPCFLFVQTPCTSCFAGTYHWKCMKELGCYTDGQGQGIDVAVTWACPALSASEAKWKLRSVGNHSTLNAIHVNMPGSKKCQRLTSDKRQLSRIPTSPHIGNQEQLFVPDQSCPILMLKVPDWRTWIYTDGSCQIQNGIQEIGAGVYCPLTDSR
eukprot:1146926-Pelagomonas_calceolata.AAC.9